MKTIFRTLGLVLIALAFLLFLYGSIKTARGKAATNDTVELAPGIRVVKENNQQRLARKTFQTSVVFLAGGVVLLALSFRGGRRKLATR